MLFFPLKAGGFDLNKLFLAFGFVLLVAAFAVSARAEQAQITDAQAQEFVSFYNANIDKVPGYVKGFLGNEVIEINLSYSNGSDQQFGVRTKDALITAWQPKPYNDTTMALSTNQAAIEKIASAKETLKEFKAQWGTGIKYEARNWMTGIKLFLANLFIGFA